MTNPAAILLDTLGAHSVKAQHVKTWKGPSVALYAFKLEAGQSVKSVLSIAQDLAVAVGQEAVRILAPIPGTTWIGVEVPNETRCTVDYEPTTSDWQGEGSLPIPIGVDVKNHVIEADLTDLPHLLIAGSTGSGKSVALNTIITALIDRNNPSNLRLHLIDPKRVELAQFADAPQVESLVTDLDEAQALLESIVDEMDRRYELFEHEHVRNISEFNRIETAGHKQQPLPFHVVVIDEMADLMLQRKKEIEPLIVRIAQLARAAGIHLILATQRPTVDVITGLIKANVPSRLAFTVASVKDSMVILDQTGANALAGKGDALFLPVGQQRPMRVQGLWTSDEIIETVVQHAGAPTVEGWSNQTLNQRADDGLDEDYEDGLPVRIDQLPEIPAEYQDLARQASPSPFFDVEAPVLEDAEITQAMREFDYGNAVREQNFARRLLERKAARRRDRIETMVGCIIVAAFVLCIIGWLS